MTKRLNLIEKKLKFHCSVCQATYQLLVIRTDLMTNQETKCLNNCSNKWESLLIAYCQERQIIYFVSQEQAKEEKQQDLTDLLNKVRKENAK